MQRFCVTGTTDMPAAVRERPIIDVRDVIRLICREAKEADDKAMAACARSKYSVQDYWLCIEFRMQQLADRIARKAGLAMRCPKYPFRQRVDRLRKEEKAEVERAERPRREP